MILLWRQTGKTEHRTSWQGMQFLLQYNTTSLRWHLYVDGKRVKQNWRSVGAAKEAIDVVQNRKIMEARQYVQPSAA